MTPGSDAERAGMSDKTLTHVDETGEARMVEVLKQNHDQSASVVLEKLIGAVRTFAHGAEQYDDVTALVVKYTGAK